MKAVFDKFWRYFITAGLAAIVDIGGFVALTAAALPATPAAVTSFAIALCVNYTLTTRFVYACPLSWRGFGRFAVAAIAGFVINVAVTLLLFKGLGWPAGLAKTGGVGIAFVCNFAMVNFWIYGQKRTEP